MDKLKTIGIAVFAVFLFWIGKVDERTLSVQPSKDNHTFCAMCETKIDTVNDKALRQWMDTDIRIKFKKWLILGEKKK